MTGMLRPGSRCLRALLLAAVGSLLCVPVTASAQGVALRLHIGASASTTLARDLVAAPQVRQLFGGAVDQEVRLRTAPGITAGAGVLAQLRDRLTLDASLDWTATGLRVEEDGSARSLQDASIVEATAVVSHAVLRRLHAGAGIGLLALRTPSEGVFRDGARVSPLLEGRVSAGLPVMNDRVALVARGQLHRFGTPALRAAGAADGTVARLSVQAHVRVTRGTR